MNLLSRSKPVVGPTTTAEDPDTVGYVVAVVSRDTRRVMHLTDTELRTRAQALAEIETWQSGIATPNRRWALCKVVVAE